MGRGLHTAVDSFLMAMDDLAGRTLGPYELWDQIGTGGMAVVYRGAHRGLGQPCAIKVLNPALADDTGLVERFKSEAKIAARLRHPNIVPVLDVGEEGGLHYLVMAYVEGVPLSRLLRQEGPLSFQRAIMVLRQLAAALDFAHENGIVHRDVKSANVLVSQDDRVTLFDFGIARTGGTVGRLTGPGMIVGTPQYLAPEVITGGEGDRGTDLYAFGTLAYETLVGRVPFDGADSMAVLHAQVNQAPRPPRELRPEIPPAAEQILLRQLSKAPHERFSTADAFVRALASTMGLDADAPETPAPSGRQLAPDVSVVNWLAAAPARPPGDDLFLDDPGGRLGPDPELPTPSPFERPPAAHLDGVVRTMPNQQVPPPSETAPGPSAYRPPPDQTPSYNPRYEQPPGQSPTLPPYEPHMHEPRTDEAPAYDPSRYGPGWNGAPPSAASGYAAPPYEPPASLYSPYQQQTPHQPPPYESPPHGYPVSRPSAPGVAPYGPPGYMTPERNPGGSGVAAPPRGSATRWVLSAVVAIGVTIGVGLGLYLASSTFGSKPTPTPTLLPFRVRRVNFIA